MSKMNDGGLNEVAISLAALKQSAIGDEVVVLGDDGQVSWLAVDSLVAVRGCKGGTTIALRNIVTGDVATHTLRSDLPTGMARIRRVSAGVNARTMRKMAVAPAAPKAPVVQPLGEFENILDVPVVEEGHEVVAAAEAIQESTSASPEAPVGEVAAEPIVETEATETAPEPIAEVTESTDTTAPSDLMTDEFIPVAEVAEESTETAVDSVEATG